MTSSTPRTSAARLAAVVFSLFAVLNLGSRPASAQWRAAQPGDPVEVEAHWVEEGVRIRLSIDDGWYIYGVDADHIGLPLNVLAARGDERLPLTAQRPPEVIDIEGERVPIHRGRPTFLIENARGDIAVLRVRWAGCRGDICIPRESRVSIDGGRSAIWVDPPNAPTGGGQEG